MTCYRFLLGVVAMIAGLAGVTLYQGALTAIAAPSAQPIGLNAVHRSGQTFLTWQEQPGAATQYRVYRHSAPITSANLAQAMLLYDGVPQDSARFYANRYNVESSGVWDERYTERLVIADRAAPLAAGIGLLVWTLAPADFGGAQEGSGYYAITTVQTGVENRTDFGPGNTVGPVAERADDPLPVELAVSGTDPGGHIYVQYMPLRTWNVTFHAPNPLNGHYGLDETEPAIAHAIQYAYDYAVYEPSAADCGGSLPASLAVVVSLHGWAGNAYGPRTSDPDPYGWCAYRIYPIDQSETWWFGFAREHDYHAGGAPEAGDTIVNYTEQRTLRMVHDLQRDPPGPAVDANRVYIFGNSMGASGTLAFALRYPNVFAAAYAGQPMTNYATSGDGGGVDWRNDTEPKWGAVAANLPVSIGAPGNWAGHLQSVNGTGVWTWQNHQAQLVARRAVDMTPLGIAHGVEDDVIEWSTQGRPVYPALNSSRQVWGGATVPGGHSWTGFGGSLYNLDMDTRPGSSQQPFFGFLPVRDESVPGLSNASPNAPLPPNGAGEYNLAVRWSASWDAWDGAPVDTLTRWQMSFCYQAPERYVDDCGSGSPLTVDITPRRVQHFAQIAGASYRWENRRVGDNTLVGSGVVVADGNGLVTVPAFALENAAGNRLILEPAASPIDTLAYLPVVQKNPARPAPTPTPAPAARQWPDTGSGIHVFNDQVPPALSDAQWEFAATHYAGVQKMTRSDADILHGYNPDLMILHYRLGLGLGYRVIENGCAPTGELIRIIEGDAWLPEWPTNTSVYESWFANWPEDSGEFVLNCDWGWYLTELNDPSWRAYWQGEVLRQLQANDNDGVFMDSLSVPNYLGADHYDPALPAIDESYEAAWAERIDDWLAWLQTQPIGDYAIVPNVGNWVTTRDPTTYAAADGVMFEGFAMWGEDSPYAVDDWRLQMNRALGLIGQGKAVIAQAYVGDGRERLFALGSYLLIKGNRTYLNLESSMEPEWWPEYDIEIGSALQPPASDIDDLASGGVYRRDFTNGFVLVNPADDGAAVNVNLGGAYRLVQPNGGGPVGEDGVSTGTLSYQVVSSVNLPPYSAAVLLQMQPD